MYVPTDYENDYENFGVGIFKIERSLDIRQFTTHAKFNEYEYWMVLLQN